MIDIHHHLIYGVDDGPPDLESSLAMAREAVSEGVTRIVCTPHSSDAYPYQTELVNERIAELRSLLAGEIELSLACDFHMTVDNIEEACAHPLRYSIDGKGYLLIEFASFLISPVMNDAIFALQSAGYTIIVTHPERYQAVQREPALIAYWMCHECLMQVTAGSLYGRFGPAPQALANELLDRNWVHFIASDAHNPQHRPPHLKKAYNYVANRAGQETARRLCVDNPQAAVEGVRLAPQPEPVGLWENVPLKFHLRSSMQARKRQPERGPDSADNQPIRAKSLWKRLFSR